jgi:hypothetical protein
MINEDITANYDWLTVAQEGAAVEPSRRNESLGKLGAFIGARDPILIA